MSTVILDYVDYPDEHGVPFQVVDSQTFGAPLDEVTLYEISHIGTVPCHRLLLVLPSDKVFNVDGLHIFDSDPYLSSGGSADELVDGRWVFEWDILQPVDFMHMFARLENVI